MALTRGDTNATLKDLTIIAEDTLVQTRPNLVPKLCSVKPEEGAYTKVPVPANVPFPKKFEGERESHGKLVNVFQQYDQATYELTIDLDSDLMRNVKAYDFEGVVREAAVSAVIYPDYLLSQAIINGDGAGYTGYDGQIFYYTTHYFAKMGTSNINNILSGSGATDGITVPGIAKDLAAAIAKIRSFKDNQGRLLNPLAPSGASQFIIQCPVGMEQAFRQVIFGSMIPMPATYATSGPSSMPVANNVLQGIADIFPDGYLDDSDANDWYLHFVGMPQRPFVYFENYPPMVQVLGFGSEHEINTNTVRIAIKHRFVLGYYRFDRSIAVQNS